MTGGDYDFWLLDLDGTLIDVEHWYIYEVFDRVGARLDTTFTEAESKALWYGYGDERAAILDDRSVNADRFWDIFHEEERPQARAGATHLYEDAEAFVPALSEPVGLVTHCQEYLTGPVLDHLDIADWFDTVVCCTDETGWKPDPTPVQMARRACWPATTPTTSAQPETPASSLSTSNDSKHPTATTFGPTTESRRSQNSADRSRSLCLGITPPRRITRTI